MFSCIKVKIFSEYKTIPAKRAAALHKFIFKTCKRFLFGRLSNNFIRNEFERLMELRETKKKDIFLMSETKII